MKTIFLCLIFLFYLSAIYAGQKIKVSCIGNSVTYGYLLPEREVNAYPAQLQRLLGEKYAVANFGKSGATLLRKGHRPYTEQEEYRQALEYAGDMVVIHLGLNDTDPRNWPNYRDDFIRDYTDLIASFRKVNPRCKIWICRLSPIGNRHPRFRSGTRDWYTDIQQKIEKIAADNKVGLIDLQAPLYHRPDLLPDALHPVTEGAAILAKTVYSALTGDYSGLHMPDIYTDNMVLQRDRPLLISGSADAGQKVSVSIAGQKQSTQTTSDGKWNITLKPLPAGGPYTLKINTDNRTLVYHNVLIGEVWLCSGQSNMAFMLKQAATASEDLRQANNPHIRLFNMRPRWETYAMEWESSVLDSLNRLEYYTIQGWTICNARTLPDFSAVAYHFGKMLADSLNVPVGLICNAVGGSPCESWISRHTLEFDFPDILCDWKNNDMIQDWVRERASLNIKKAGNPFQRHPYEPCYLFESGIFPLMQYPIQGVIWYQGESNAHNTELHEILFPMLVNDWRNYWQQPEMPFYYVQLSSLNRPSWPWFRDSQRRILKAIPHSGMAVSSDLGDSLDVHPRHKKEIGERLARQALCHTYHRAILPSGPLFRKIKTEGKQAILEFDYAEDLKTADGQALRTFETAGDNGIFYPATAIIKGNRIIVESEKVSRPHAVRYGWQPFTRGNLVNKDNLPASTFRTDL